MQPNGWTATGFEQTETMEPFHIFTAKDAERRQDHFWMTQGHSLHKWASKTLSQHQIKLQIRQFGGSQTLTGTAAILEGSRWNSDACWWRRKKGLRLPLEALCCWDDEDECTYRSVSLRLELINGNQVKKLNWKEPQRTWKYLKDICFNL